LKINCFVNALPRQELPKKKPGTEARRKVLLDRLRFDARFLPGAWPVLAGDQNNFLWRSSHAEYLVRRWE